MCLFIIQIAKLVYPYTFTVHVFTSRIINLHTCTLFQITVYMHLYNIILVIKLYLKEICSLILFITVNLSAVFIIIIINKIKLIIIRCIITPCCCMFTLINGYNTVMYFIHHFSLLFK